MRRTAGPQGPLTGCTPLAWVFYVLLFLPLAAAAADQAGGVTPPAPAAPLQDTHAAIPDTPGTGAPTRR